MFIFILNVILLTYVNASLVSNSIKNKTELVNFFRETYLQKLKSNYLFKQKRYQVPGYINGWEMFHFHHVCIRGGSDGVIIGIDDVENDWASKANKDNRIVSPADWHKYSKVRGLFPLYIHRYKYINEVNVTFKNGSTWLNNCFHQKLKSSNPAHWMMKLGAWYELAICQSNYNSTNIFSNDIDLPYKHIQMNQCPNPLDSDWHWGHTVWDIVKNRSDIAKMTDSSSRVEFIGYQMHDEIEHNKLMCFEDIYFSARMGLWMQGRANLVQFRKDTASIVHEPAGVITNPEVLNMDSLGFDATVFPNMFYMNYCNNQTNQPTKSKISSARIKIFQRTATVMLRRFINLKDVINLAQSYTTYPVEVITVNESTTVQEQIRIFNTFDVLITAHGSHLANGLFTMFPETKAVIEIVPFAFDSVFYGNYNHWLGFAEYLISTGHTTPGLSVLGRQCPFPNITDFKAHNCSLSKQHYPHKIEQSWTVCSSILHTRNCDTLVDLKILKNDLDELFKTILCKQSNSNSSHIASNLLNNKTNAS
jgi:hypothetical protein